MKNIASYKDGGFVKVHTNGGTQISSMVADYPRLSITIWYNKDSLAIIFSLAAVKKLYRVTIDTAEEAVMHVHVAANNVTAFVEMPNGSSYHDTDFPNYRSHQLSNHVSYYYYFNTVVSRIKLCTCWKIKDADKL